MLTSRISRIQPLSIILVLSILIQSCGVSNVIPSVVPTQVKKTPSTDYNKEVEDLTAELPDELSLAYSTWISLGVFLTLSSRIFEACVNDNDKFQKVVIGVSKPDWVFVRKTKDLKRIMLSAPMIDYANLVDIAKANCTGGDRSLAELVLLDMVYGPERDTLTDILPLENKDSFLTQLQCLDKVSDRWDENGCNPLADEQPPSSPSPPPSEPDEEPKESKEVSRTTDADGNTVITYDDGHTVVVSADGSTTTIGNLPDQRLEVKATTPIPGDGTSTSRVTYGRSDVGGERDPSIPLGNDIDIDIHREERVAEVGAWGGFGEDLRNVHPAG